MWTYWWASIHFSSCYFLIIKLCLPWPREFLRVDFESYRSALPCILLLWCIGVCSLLIVASLFWWNQPLKGRREYENLPLNSVLLFPHCVSVFPVNPVAFVISFTLSKSYPKVCSKIGWATLAIVTLPGVSCILSIPSVLFGSQLPLSHSRTLPFLLTGDKGLYPWLLIGSLPVSKALDKVCICVL